MNLPIPEFADSAENYIYQLEQEVTSARQDLKENANNNIGVYYMNQNQPKKTEVRPNTRSSTVYESIIQALDSFHKHRESKQILQLQQQYDQAVILRQKDQIEIWLYRIIFSSTLLFGVPATFTWHQKKKNKVSLQALQEITLTIKSVTRYITREETGKQRPDKPR